MVPQHGNYTYYFSNLRRNMINIPGASGFAKLTSTILKDGSLHSVSMQKDYAAGDRKSCLRALYLCGCPVLSQRKCEE